LLLTTNQSSYITNSSQIIGKADLLEKLKNKTNFKKKDIEIVLTALTDIIKEDVLINGSEIRLRDFGTFKQKNTLPRKGRNPRTGETLQILGSTSVTFSASSSLKSKSNNDDNDSRSSKHDNIN
jgi:nucleoid DNA-binding protein